MSNIEWGYSVTHDCRQHLKYEIVEWAETHGLDCGPYEHASQEQWVCVICKERFTAEDLEQ